MIILILFLALFLRLINLNQSLWLDEATQVILSKDSLTNIIFNRAADFHPPLSYLLMHFWEFFGTSEIWLRLLSVIFGVLTTYVLYKFCLEIFNKQIALLSAFLFSIAPYHIYYSQEIRMYSEATFFAICSMYYFYRLIKNTEIVNSLIYILFSLALIYTHYDGLFLILTQFIYLAIFKKNLFLTFAKRVFFIVLLYLPWVPQLLNQLKSGINANEFLPGWESVLSIPFYKAIPLTFFKFSFGRIDFDNKNLYILIAGFVLIIFGIVLYRGIQKLKEVSVFICWLFIPIITATLISFEIPINQPFRVLFVLPAFYILLAKGIINFKNLSKLFFVLIVIITLSGLLIYYINPKYQREDWKGASSYILSILNNNSLVLFAWPESFPPYQWYGKSKQSLGVVNNFPAKYDEVDKNFGSIENVADIYFFEYLQTISDPEKLVNKNLEDRGFTLSRVYNFNGVGFIDHYVKK